MLRVLALFVALCVSATASQVKVEVYYESMCPACADFTTGPLKSAMAKSDIYEIVDLKMVAYGNTKEVDGDFSCQHGEMECESDALELCTQYLLSGDINSIETGDTTKEAYPFIECMEAAGGQSSQVQECYNKNMPNSKVTFEEVQACSVKDFTKVTTAAMKATAPTNHTYVPWVLVDGELVEHTNLLLRSICEAYDGPKPASCRHILGSNEDERCFKD